MAAKKKAAAKPADAKNEPGFFSDYPCALEARYRNRTAAYTKAFVVSNWDFEKQYDEAPEEDRAAWMARFHRIRVYTAYCTYNEYTVEDYFKMKNGEYVKPLCEVKPEAGNPQSDDNSPASTAAFIATHTENSNEKERDT